MKLSVYTDTCVPATEQPSENDRFRHKTCIPGQLDLVQLEDFIVQLYPRVQLLSRVGFTFMKADKTRQLIKTAGVTVAELHVELGRSQLFVRPKHDLLHGVSSLYLMCNVTFTSCAALY